MELTETRLNEIVQSCIQDDSLFMVELRFKKGSNGYQIALIIDGDNGISIDTCSDISRCINHEIEELGLIEEIAKIEVSSPGLDYPLTTPRQYRKNVGRQLKVLLNSDKEISGKLLDVPDDLTVLLQTKNKKKTEEVKLEISEIVKTKVIPSFK